MRTKKKNLLLIGVLWMLPFLLSGCYLQLLFAYIGQEDEYGDVSIGGDIGSVKHCDDTFNFELGRRIVECTYTITDQDGFLDVISSTTDLVGAFGVFGLFLDPLVVQVPDNATDFGGDMNKGFGPLEFRVTETDTFKATPHITVNAEPGHKFVIVEFPPAVLEELESNGSLAGNYTYDFGFRVPNVQAFDVKPMLTVQVTQDNETYLVPMLPCTTDFAQVPPITINPAGSGSNPMPQILDALEQNPDLPCDNAVYSFGTAASADFFLYLPLLDTGP